MSMVLVIQRTAKPSWSPSLLLLQIQDQKSVCHPFRKSGEVTHRATNISCPIVSFDLTVFSIRSGHHMERISPSIILFCLVFLTYNIIAPSILNYNVLTTEANYQRKGN